MPLERLIGTRRRSEGGHLLILLMVGVTVMLIMMTVAAQSWTFRMRREMELELIHRGEQYVQALENFRKTNGGAFPVGDLKILEKKGPMGQRFIRKLYPNPFDPNGQWQYLYLHPGGSGFINPCATMAGVPGMPGVVSAGMPGAIPGGMSGIPVRGMNVGRGGSRQGSVFGSGTLSGRGMTRSSSRKGGASSMGALSAIDPEAFKKTGMAKMNLPIVGVVNCEQKESIRIYKSQTWLSNWAFTPLAQGEFGGIAQRGRGQGAAPSRMAGGFGLHGGEFDRATPGGRRRERGSTGGTRRIRGQEDPEQAFANERLNRDGPSHIGRQRNAEGRRQDKERERTSRSWRWTRDREEDREEPPPDDDVRDGESEPDPEECEGEDCPDPEEAECEGEDCPDPEDEDCEGEDCPDPEDEDCEGEDCEDDFDDGFEDDEECEEGEDCEDDPEDDPEDDDDGR